MTLLSVYAFSQSQSRSQIYSMLSPKTLTYGVFDYEFGFELYDLSCSHTLTMTRTRVAALTH